MAAAAPQNALAFDASRARRIASELRSNWELASSGTDAVDPKALEKAAGDSNSPIHASATALLSDEADRVAFKFFDWSTLDDFGTDGGFFDGRITQAGLDRALVALRPDLTDGELATTLHNLYDRMDLFGADHGLDGQVHKAELVQAVELDRGDPSLTMMHRFEHSERSDQLTLWNALSVLLQSGRFDSWAARTGDPAVLELSDLHWENP